MKIEIGSMISKKFENNNDKKVYGFGIIFNKWQPIYEGYKYVLAIGLGVFILGIKWKMFSRKEVNEYYRDQ